MLNKTPLEAVKDKEASQSTQQWKWFIGLYIFGFLTLTGFAYTLKGMMSFL
ncbi:hypothetical protein O1D97_08860 [Marinomonas sp. 15G1-11]|uniref:DUF2474 domain-containing protein n=1 Tax=Marinomonas phaeophyticola TaxID=3004091 RepID=A0ABT4JTU7_9GAMM|nr:hypothetical protein [Marinomonas sp. 15G1-11]MCZ2721759.1 hypothetical protein [Marinomonas sp. 15G1-11]